MNSRKTNVDTCIYTFAIVGSELELARWMSVADNEGIAIVRKGQYLGIGNDKVKLGVCMAISVTGLEINDGRYLLHMDTKWPIERSTVPLELVRTLATGISYNIELYQYCYTEKKWNKISLAA